MKHIIIGTAGHIDHGKTALIKALTGRNTDRLKEEQQRGITIDLGFTWFDLDDGTRCGIIDVPGHEKFIHNMAAGVVGMDLVLMVVAADEGVMPQTREHLDILQLLGVEKCILVLSKCDLADEEWIDMVEMNTREELRGTILENAPCVRVSSVTGQGLGALKALILEMVRDQVTARDVNSIPRLPIDRVFSVPGYGTVVTGTLLSGSISKGETLTVFPVGKSSKVRNIQVHETDQETCVAGQRAALNIPNIKKEEIYRGCVLAPADSMESTTLIDVDLHILKSSTRTIRNRERFHLFTGTSEILCRAVLLDRQELGPDESGFAQLQCEEPVVVRRGDRFVVRFYSPMETSGGGIVLEPNPGKKKRFSESAIEELKMKKLGSLTDACELNIKAAADGPVPLRELSKHMSHSEHELRPCLDELLARGAVIEFPLNKDTWLWHADNAFVLEQKIARALKSFYDRYPYRRGIPKAEIRSMFMKRFRPNIFDACLDYMAGTGTIRIRDEYVCLADYEMARDETFAEIEHLLTRQFEEAAYQLLRFSEVDRGPYSEEIVTDVLRALVDEGSMVRVSAEPLMYTMRHLADAAAARVKRHFETEEILTVRQVRDMFGTNRKSAKAIIEYLDGIKVTRKVGAETERVACI